MAERPDLGLRNGLDGGLGLRNGQEWRNFGLRNGRKWRDLGLQDGRNGRILDCGMGGMAKTAGPAPGLLDFRRLQRNDAVEQLQIQAVADGLRQLVILAIPG